jgi:hypothetical protein
MNLGQENTMMGGIVAENCVSRTVRDNAMLFSLTEDTGDYARFKPIGFVAGPVNGGSGLLSARPATVARSRIPM